MKITKTLLIAGGFLFAANAALADGKSVYNSGCAACHASGVAGAPKLGDKEGWTDRVTKDVEEVYSNAIKGYQGENGVMPPKGGFTNLSDDEVKEAVDYMLAEGQ